MKGSLTLLLCNLILTCAFSQERWDKIVQQMEDSISSGRLEAAGLLAASHLRKAKRSAPDSILSGLYFGLALGEYRSNTAGGIAYLDSAIHYANQAGDYAYSIRMLNAKSSFLKKIGDLQTAKQISVKAFNVSRTSVPDHLFLSARNASVNYRLLGRYDSALYYILIADSVAEDEQQKYISLQGVSNIYVEMGRYTDALGVSKELITLGNTQSDHMLDWLNLGRVYILLNQYDSAMQALDQSKAYAEDLKDSIELANIHGLIGDAHYKKGDYTAALHNLEKSVIYSQPDGPVDIMASAQLTLARTRFALGEMRSAKNHAIRSLEFSAREELKELQMNGYELLSRIDKALKNYDEAYDHLMTHQRIKDELNQRDRIKTIEELRTRYETSKKEQEIRLLEKDNQLKDLRLSQQQTMIMVAILFLILAAAIVVLIYRQNRIKSEQERAQWEQRLLRSQMNPHFIFNALTSIQNFILSNQKKEASSYLGKFGDLTRDILEASRAEFISFEQEIRMLTNYVDLESVRFSKKITFHVDLDETIDPGFDQLPPLLIQPFVENTFKHGFKDQEAGSIHIKFKLIQRLVEVTVADDGIGLKSENSDHVSRALEITQSRLELLAKKYRFTPSLTVENRRDRPGVVVAFVLPLAS